MTSGNHSPSWELVFVILARWSFGWLCGPPLVLSDNGWPGLRGGCSWGEVEGKLRHGPAPAILDQWQHPTPSTAPPVGAWQNSWEAPNNFVEELHPGELARGKILPIRAALHLVKALITTACFDPHPRSVNE